jgi:hypothetical protein
MKLVIRTVFFQFSCILFFGLIYLFLIDHFVRDEKFTLNKSKTPEILDCLFLATTIQSGVGYTDLYPITDTSKMVLIIQQFIMISTNIFLLYIFTL